MHPLIHLVGVKHSPLRNLPFRPSLALSPPTLTSIPYLPSLALSRRRHPLGVDLLVSIHHR